MAQYWFEPLVADIGAPPSNIAIAQPWDSATLATNTVSNTIGVPTWDVTSNFGGTFHNAIVITDIDGSPVAPSDRFEVFARLWNLTGGNNKRLCCAISGGATSKSGYVFGGTRSEGKKIDLFDADVKTVLGSQAVNTTNATWHTRASFAPGSPKLKVWIGSSAEPGAWDIQTSNGVSLPAGLFGIYEPTLTGTLRVLTLAVGTDGDPAPTGPVPPPSSRQRSRLILTPW